VSQPNTEVIQVTLQAIMLRSSLGVALLAGVLVVRPAEAQRIAVPSAAFTDTVALAAAVPRLAGQAAAEIGRAHV